jgi:hypothetical protein
MYGGISLTGGVTLLTLNAVRSSWARKRVRRREVNIMEIREFNNKLVYGRSSFLGAMAWMFGLSFLLTLLLGWIPIVGPFLGPVIGGYVGGSRAGTALRALGAAILPAILLSILLFGLAALAAGLSHLQVVGAIAAIVASAISLIVIIHNLLLFLAALAGGLVRQLRGY